MNKLGGNFSLEGSFQFIYLDVGSTKGRIIDTRVTLNYRITKNVGIGVGYNFFSTRIDQTKTNFTGRVKINYDGGQAFLNIFF